MTPVAGSPVTPPRLLLTLLVILVVVLWVLLATGRL